MSTEYKNSEFSLEIERIENGFILAVPQGGVSYPLKQTFFPTIREIFDHIPSLEAECTNHLSELRPPCDGSNESKE